MTHWLPSLTIKFLKITTGLFTLFIVVVFSQYQQYKTAINSSLEMGDYFWSKGNSERTKMLGDFETLCLGKERVLNQAYVLERCAAEQGLSELQAEREMSMSRIEAAQPLKWLIRW